MKKLKSTCYDCGRRVDRATTVPVYRANTQGKSARVRVCAPACTEPNRRA